ncbi:ATP-binding protein [Burkholderia sp. 22PA0099]|uniref:ATP-binding protein n=1 Tax=Burkholderia sp. 22PA0099 TaxID=3237372 RepID=UPI0039C4A172
MKVGITSKLFLAILVTCVAVAVAMGAAMRYSFENGFVRYLVGRDDEEVARVTKALESRYATHGNWDFITATPEAWPAFVRSVAPIFPHDGMGPDGWAHGNPPGAGPRGDGDPFWRDGGFGGPPRGSDGRWRGRGSWDGAASDAEGGERGMQGDRDARWRHERAQRDAEASAGSNAGSSAVPSANSNAAPDNIPRHRAPWDDHAGSAADAARHDGYGMPYDGWRDRPPGFRHLPPIALFDAARHRLAGYPPPPDTPLHALRAGGKVVGWLSIAKPGGLFYAADQRFQMQQSRATWVIVVAAAVLSALVAMVLARLILAPVRRIVRATHRLAEGQYAVRVPERGSDELSQLAVDFNKLAASLAAAERARRDFFADISHELRTPLAVLRGEVEALEDGVRRPDAATFASLQSEIALLSKLIDDLHELSLADIGALSFEMIPVDVARVVEITAESFVERLGAKRIALDTKVPAEPALMSGDPHRLAQLLQNLLENSLRYTDPGGAVQVAVTARGEQWQIDVLDSHPAVPDAMLANVFDRLFRVDVSRSRQSGGSGLGLALCKHIVEAHGGTIAARRSPLGGLWIMMLFPSLKPDHEH